MIRTICQISACACIGLLGACAAPQPAITDEMLTLDGPDLPVDLDGSWAMDYARSDNVNDVLRETMYQISRSSGRSAGLPGADLAGPINRDMAKVMPLARLAELITRSDELTITQTDNEIIIDRIDDFSMFCAFYGGVSKPTESAFGKETCGWDGNRLVSHMEFLDGLEVVNRFAVSDDGKQLRIITTVASDTSRVPFTLSRYYWKFEKPAPAYDCIETLSMKRVCTTGTLER